MMTDFSLHDQVTAEFEQAFSKRPMAVAHAPGRVNLIGEHTDYQEGFVLPMTVDRYVAVAFAPRSDRMIRAHTSLFNKTVEYPLDGLTPIGQGCWSDYIMGTAWAMHEAGFPLIGIDIAVKSDLPMGAGLSSSAALEVAMARALCSVSQCTWDPIVMAQLARRAENEFVGVGCGIMDQVASTAGKANCALLLDCRSLQFELVRLPSQVGIVVMDTGVRRSLGATDYDTRRKDCATAFAAIKTFAPHAAALRDVNETLLARAEAQLSTSTYRRAQHVVTENLRPIKLAKALQSGNFENAGELLNDSHASLRDLYEVSSPELDLITDLARSESSCLGARMTGAGFGGSAIALVRTEGIRRFIDQVRQMYAKCSEYQGSFFHGTAVDGVSVRAMT